MNIAIILISVLAPLIIVAIFGYSVFNWRKNAIAKDKYQKGNTIVWKFDEKTRRFISYNILGEPVTNLKMIESGTWVPVSYLTDNYPEHVQKCLEKHSINLIVVWKVHHSNSMKSQSFTKTTWLTLNSHGIKLMMVQVTSWELTEWRVQLKRVTTSCTLTC